MTAALLLLLCAMCTQKGAAVGVRLKSPKRLKCNEYVIEVSTRGADIERIRSYAQSPKADKGSFHVGVPCGREGQHMRKFSILDMPWDAIPANGRKTPDTMCVRVKCSKRTNEVQKVVALDECPDDRYEYTYIHKGRVVKAFLGSAWYQSLMWDRSTVWDPSTETNSMVNGENCVPHDLTKEELKQEADSAVLKCEEALRSDPKYKLAQEAVTQEKPFDFHVKTVAKQANALLRKRQDDPKFRDRMQERLQHYSAEEIANEMHGKFAVTPECLKADSLSFFKIFTGGKNEACRESLTKWIEKQKKRCSSSGPTVADRHFREIAEQAIPDKRKMMRNIYYEAPPVDDVKSIEVLRPMRK